MNYDNAYFDFKISKNIEIKANFQQLKPIINQPNKNCWKCKKVFKCDTKKIQCDRCEHFFHKNKVCATIDSGDSLPSEWLCFYCKREIKLTIFNCMNCKFPIHKTELISCTKCDTKFHHLIYCCGQKGSASIPKDWVCKFSEIKL